MTPNAREFETPLDPNEAQGLIPNIRFQEELNRFEQESILEARRWAEKSRKLRKELVTVSGLIALHKRMFNGVWRWAGTFRETEKNLGVAPHLIPAQLAALCGDVSYQIEHQTFAIEEIAVRFHHRLVQIHPFPNGNGRHARLAADLLLIHRGGQALPWGRSALAASDIIRREYIRTLRLADSGDNEPLLSFAKTSFQN